MATKPSVILAIETSCDETAISIVAGNGGLERPMFATLAHVVSSQIKLHAPYGGVVPSLAKRAHSENLVPVLEQALTQATMLQRKSENTLDLETSEQVNTLLAREPGLADKFISTIPYLCIPEIDAIAVTAGPGLEPALWVGINFAKTLALVWGKPLIAVNHMEGHIASALGADATSTKLENRNSKLKFPALALLISGGHTELVLMRRWFDYEVIGETRDDAVGEAFDKVARILGLPYPGGPAIGQLALGGEHRPEYRLPRPMLDSGDFDFSFSGLKTAALYLVKKIGELTQKDRADIAKEFQQAAIDVLVKKTLGAIKKHKPKTVIIGGGVIANQELRQQFTAALATYPDITLLIPEAKLTTDNATMIGMAAYLHTNVDESKTSNTEIKAEGNLRL